MQDASATPVVPLQPNPAPITPLSSKMRSSLGATMGGAQSSAISPQISAQPAIEETQITTDLDLVSDADKLGIFSAVIDQLEAEQPSQTLTQTQASDDTSSLQGSVLDQMLPNAVIVGTDTLNPASPVGSSVAKERASTSDQTAVETATGIQHVEQEPNPEIPVEVENFIQRVTDHAQTAPKEVVIADGTHEQPKVAYPSRPVIVLPINQQTEEEGQKKSPKFSIRWLVEWSHKIIKMFAGKVIYRQAEAEN